MEFTELGSFSFCYRTQGVRGMGFSSSSNFAVLYEAMNYYLRNGPPLDVAAVAEAALSFERRLALGMAVAADDVYPVVYGGVNKIQTSANISGKSKKPRSGVKVTPVPHDPRWLSDHVTVALRPNGKRHDIPDLLAGLFRAPEAATTVRQISALARHAARAVSACDIGRLAEAVNRCRTLVDAWTVAAPRNSAKRRAEPPPFTRSIAGLAAEMECELKNQVLAWKPPGGGASESMIVLSPNVTARDAVIDFFKCREWCAHAACVTTGLSGEFMTNNGEVRITAGHRLDFVGGADLGQGVGHGVAGCCCSCTIEPRTEIIVRKA